jgi:glutamyl/glutaminyl-tRNA synthetase
VPIFAHIPVFLNPDGKGKMSKRKGMVSAASFLDRGYLPEAMLNFFMILGWAKQDQKEVISLSEYIQEFDPSDLSSNSVAFDMKKLNWLNGVYIRQLSHVELKERILPFVPSEFPMDKLDQVLPLIQERLITLADFTDLTKFFYTPIDYTADLLMKKATSSALVKDELEQTITLINSLDTWQLQTLEEEIRNLQEKNDWHKGQYFMMLRIAATGEKATPPLFATIEILGKELFIKRLRAAIDKLV